LETVVLVELERRRMGVTYVRTPGGYEVDFLARRPSEQPELIQVCADLGTAEVVERELRALEDVAKTFPKATRRLLTLTRDAMPDVVPRNVIVQPAYEWLLQEPD
jgi:predicted AAA+ superfamily ATPase